MPSARSVSTVVLLTCVTTAGCDRATDVAPTALSPTVEPGLSSPAVPTPLEAVATPFGSVSLWPFTGVDVQGTPSDPINLIFLGQSDVRALRAALMFLDGDRTAYGLPPVPPFNCTWDDAVGASQTAYTESSGWSGSVVQLECGDYDPVRFHIRLFESGDVTLGNAHFEVIVPGTSSHQVLSWELAKQLAVIDLLRTGLLDGSIPMVASTQIHPSPYREIPDFLYNGLPVELRGAIGGPLSDVAQPVPIWTDGTATAFNLVNAATISAGVATREFTIEFGQVIPKPFCAPGPGSFLYVSGPVEVRQTVRVTPSGNLHSSFMARGTLELTPVNPSTLPPTPIGKTYVARVLEVQHSVATDRHTLVSHLQIQAELPPMGADRGRLMSMLRVGPGSSAGSDLTVQCGG